MFRGITSVNMDAKGRLAIPTRYRARVHDESEGKMVVTIDTEDSCLLLYPLSEWESIESKIESLSSFNKATRRIQRLLIGHATEVEVDANGRVLLPAILRQHAKLSKKTILVGQGRKFEIWSEEGWQEKRELWLADDAGDDEIPPELQELSL
jgi:MraZ protein